jgi:hypothetical protein
VAYDLILHITFHPAPLFVGLFLGPEIGRYPRGILIKAFSKRSSLKADTFCVLDLSDKDLL